MVPSDNSDLALGQHLLAAAERWPDAPHLRTVAAAGEVAIRTYRESAELATAIAGKLIVAGVRPGDPVAVLGDSTPLEVAAIFGVWLAGCVLVPLDPLWRPEAHVRAMRKAGVKVGLALPEREHSLRLAAAEVTGFAVVTATDPSTADEVALPWVDPESRALTLFTSGTTGEPKAAVLSHRALAWNAAAVLKIVRAGREDNLLNVLPLHHSFGLLVSVVLPPMRGASVTFPASLKGPDVVLAMATTEVTIVAAVPQLMLGFDRAIQQRLKSGGWLRRTLVASLVQVCAGVRDLTGVNLGRVWFRAVHERFGGRLRFLGSAGAALDPVVSRRLRALGLNVVEGYGMTEAGPAITFERGDRPVYGSAGFALAGVDIRLHEPDADGVGEIVVRSPSLFEGYLDDPAGTAEVLRDGWLHTGDLGRRKPDGRLFITGRVKEVIVLGSGKNVYPHEVEARLLDCRFVKECCVVGLARDGRPGTEKLHVVVVPNLDDLRAAGVSRIAVTLSDEIVALGDRLPSHHRVVGVTIRGEPLPRTPLGKLKRFQILKELQAAAPPAKNVSEEPSPSSEYWPAVERALGRAAVSPPPRIVASAGLEIDLGLDSLGRVEALAALEEELEQRLPEGFGADAMTAGEVLEAVEKYLLDGPPAVPIAVDGHAFTATRARLGRRIGRPIGWVLIALLYLPMWLVLRLLWGFRVHGREHLPEGAFLICPNHGSYLDAIIIEMALPLRHLFQAWALGDHAIFTNPIMNLIAVLGNVVALDVGAGLRRTLDLGGGVLRAGLPLILFPEGTRAPVGERLAFRRGAAMLARATGAVIVPTWLEGVDRMLPRGRARLGLGHRVAVRFGTPIVPAEFDAERDPGAAMTARLRDRVMALGAEEQKTPTDSK